MSLARMKDYGAYAIQGLRPRRLDETIPMVRAAAHSDNTPTIAKALWGQLSHTSTAIYSILVVARNILGVARDVKSHLEHVCDLVRTFVTIGVLRI